MALLDDIRSHVAVMNPGQRERRTAVLLREAAAEIERLRLAIRRLADQDATLSVCEGNVTVTMDAALTDAEREAITVCIQDIRFEDVQATLRALLKRTT
jgi:hypothetical protein